MTDFSEIINKMKDQDNKIKYYAFDKLRLYKDFHEKYFEIVSKASDNTKFSEQKSEMLSANEFARFCTKVSKKAQEFYNNEDAEFKKFSDYLKSFRTDDIGPNKKYSEKCILEKYLVNKIGKRWFI